MPNFTGIDLVAYKTVRDVWAGVCGLPADTLTDAQKARFNIFFNRAIRRGWDWFFWPALMLLEERHYRATWTATSYAEDAEVWHEGTETYYRANAAAILTDVPGVSSKWDELTDLNPYVAYEQSGATAFTHVKEIWNANFRTTRGAAKLEWEYDELGVRITSSSVPTTSWLYFRQRCPKWLGADYSAGTAYASGQTRFYSSASTGFEGDFWTTNQSTTAGENPETHAAKWDKMEIPEFFCDFVANAAKILELEGDAKFEQALRAEGPAWTWLMDERDRVQSRIGSIRRVRVKNI